MNALDFLFLSKEAYLAKQAAERNALQAFPARIAYSLETFLLSLGRQDLLISGGTPQERARVFVDLLKRAPAALPKVVLSSGNPCLEADAIRREGLLARPWDWDPGASPAATYPQLLALLAARERTLIGFWVFALDVCQAMGLPLSVRTLRSVNWLSADWQHELLAAADRDTTLELLRRFTPELAAQAAQATVTLEELCRTANGPGFSLADAVSHPREILVATVQGRSSAMASQYLSLLTDAMERRQPFLLLIDNVYQNCPVLCSRAAGVQLGLAADDLCSLCGGDQLAQLTDRREAGVILFRHPFAHSAAALSRFFFGEYNKLLCEGSWSTSRHSPSLFSRQDSTGVSLRETKDLRLNPNLIQALSPGQAFAALPGRREGLLQLDGGSSLQIR